MEEKAEAAVRLRELYDRVKKAKSPACSVHPGSLVVEGAPGTVGVKASHQIDKDVERCAISVLYVYYISV